jgi:hypothetical protein
MCAAAVCIGIALHKLARCYERGKDLDAAARCYEANLARIDAEQLQGQDAPDALLFLATYKKVCHYGLRHAGSQFFSADCVFARPWG